MDRFKELSTFVEVAQRGSLSAAAREEGITPAMVGRRIDQLEERLGVKLFKRSTRKVTLTPEGTTFFEDCHRVLDELRTAEDSLTLGAKSASGRLIITAPTAFGRKHIAPHLSAAVAATINAEHGSHESAVAALVTACSELEAHPEHLRELADRLRLLARDLAVRLEAHLAFEEAVAFPEIRRFDRVRQQIIRDAMRARRERHLTMAG